MAGELSYYSKESVVRGHHVYKHMGTGLATAATEQAYFC